jgi:NAD(P)H-hydrate repair Nnr-like enzyme with NAD(P)H-hydrate epimerase domain
MSVHGRAVLLFVSTVALAGGLFAACGETVIDDVKTEDAIEQNLTKSAGKKVSAVECPSGVEVEAETTFDCTVTLAGGKEETATMKILNEDADIELSNLKAAK